MADKNIQRVTDTARIRALVGALDQALPALERLAALSRDLLSGLENKQGCLPCQTCEKKLTCRGTCDDLKCFVPAIQHGRARRENLTGLYPDTLHEVKDRRRFDVFAGYGIMVVIGTGTLGDMSKFISSSFQYKFFFNVSEGDQMLRAKHNLLLPHGGEAMLRDLDPGHCIAQQTQLGWSHPMWCEVFNVAPDRSRCDIEYDPHPFIASKCLDELPELQSFLKERIAERARGNIRRDSATSKYARRFLNAAILHPFKPVAKLWSDVGTNIRSATQARARKELEAAKLARYAGPRLSRRKVLLTQPEDPAYELFGHCPPKHRGHGDIEHTHYCNWINMVGQAEGHRTKMEALIQGTTHLADVIWQVGEELWAFEVISKCHQNIIGHLTASFIQSDAVSFVIIVAPQKRVLEQVKKLVCEEMSLAPYEHRIRYELVEVYMERLWS